MGWLAGWKKRVKFTIDHDDIDSALSWFPVRIHLSTGSGSATEEQTTSTAYDMLYNGGWTRIGQRLTISSRTVTRLSFLLHHNGNANGNVTFTIRQLDDTVLASKVWGDGNSLTTLHGGAWYEVIFDTPVLINEEVRICCEFSGGSGILHGVAVHRTTNVKASELWTYYDGSWADYSPYDCTYKYTYSQDISCIFDEVGANSKRIAIVPVSADQIDANQLYGEIEKWDSVNELADIWTSKDGWGIADDADEEVYLYYDNTHADNDTYIGVKNSTPAQSVWDGDFMAVWHMADGASTSAIYDSTSNNNDGTKKGANEPNEVAGQIGYAQDIDGSNDYISIANAASLNPADEITLEGWYKPTNLTARQISGDKSLLYRMYDQRTDGKFYPILGDGTNWIDTSAAHKDIGIAAGVWQYIATTYKSSDGAMTVIRNEVVEVSTTVATGGLGSRVNALILGDHVGIGLPFLGPIDELRISDVVRTPAWKKASYESERDHLITWGSEEDRKGAAMHHYKMLKE